MLQLLLKQYNLGGGGGGGGMMKGVQPLWDLPITWRALTPGLQEFDTFHLMVWDTGSDDIIIFLNTSS